MCCNPSQAMYPAGILCLSSGKLSTPLFPKDNQHTDIIFRLSLVPSASPGLRLCKDPEVIGDVYSLYLSKAGKEKWHRRHTLERQNYCQFLCKDGTSSPSLLLGARGKNLALSSSQAQPRRKEASSPSSPCISKLPRKCARSPCTQHTPERRGTEGHPQPSSVTGWLLLLAPCPSLRRSFALVTREQGTPPPAPPRPHLPLPARTRGTSTSRARIPPAATHRRFAGRCPWQPRGGGGSFPAGRPAALQLPLTVKGPEPHVGQEDEGGQRQPHRLQQPLLLPPHRSRRRGGGDGGAAKKGARPGRPRRAEGAQLSPALGGSAGR